jgi:hypothetical protein
MNPFPDHKFFVTSDHVNHTLQFTDDIVRNFPDRLAGFDSCKRAGQAIAAEFSLHCDANSVKQETFTFHPTAFIKIVRPAVILFVIAIAFIFFKMPVVSLFCLTLSLAVFTSQFVFYKKIFDPFFPKAQGYNIFGIVEPDLDVRQQIILCGHHDAAYVFHYMTLSPRLYPFVIFGGILPFLFGVGLCLAWLLMGNQPSWIPIVMAVSFVLVLPLWWFTTDTVSPGAGDNMIAVALANEVTRIFSNSKKSGNNMLRHTRIVCLSVDAEENGLRGSMAYVSSHAKELAAIKSYALCYDTLYKSDKLIFFNNDMNLTTDLSESMANDLTSIAKGHGYGARVARMPWGGGSTDAAAFARGGVEATCMLAFDLNVGSLPKDLVYHTLKDTTDAIEPKVVEQALNVSIDYILKKDKIIAFKK